MSFHNTVWEDDGMAGIQCNGKEAGTIDGAWSPCPVCGTMLRISWMVAILEKKSRSRPAKDASRQEGGGV